MCIFTSCLTIGYFKYEPNFFGQCHPQRTPKSIEIAFDDEIQNTFNFIESKQSTHSLLIIVDYIHKPYYNEALHLSHGDWPFNIIIQKKTIQQP